LPAEGLTVSIAAGIPLASLGQWLGPERRIVRVMPNAPCLIRRGASAYCLGPHATAAVEAAARRSRELGEEHVHILPG
jgi:pyrroline-5-carboxylate reductase